MRDLNDKRCTGELLTTDQFSARFPRLLASIQSVLHENDLIFEALPLNSLVKDASEKFLVIDKRGIRKALIDCSSMEFPNSAEEGFVRASKVASSLPLRLSANIVLPKYIGSFCNRSCTLSPYFHPLSSNKTINKCQRVILGPRIASWLEQGISQTIAIPNASEVTELFLSPLEFMANREGVSKRNREDAARFQSRIIRGQWNPMICLSHADLWHGNILLQRGSALGKFMIIDWGGSMVRGLPVYDLIRLGLSFGLPPCRIRISLDRHSSHLSCEMYDLKGYLISCLGYLGLKISQWPAERYARTIESTTEFLDQVLASH